MARVSLRSRLRHLRNPALPDLALRLVDLAHEAVGDPIEALLFGTTGFERLAYPRVFRAVRHLRPHLDHGDAAVRAATALLLGVLHQAGRADREALASRVTLEPDEGVQAIVWLALCRARRSRREVRRARHVQYRNVPLMAEGGDQRWLSTKAWEAVVNIDRSLSPPDAMSDAGLDALGRGVFAFPDSFLDEALEALAREGRVIANFPLCGGDVGAVAHAFLRGPGKTIRATYPLPLKWDGPPVTSADSAKEETPAPDVPLHPDFVGTPDPVGLDHPFPLRTLRGSVRFRPPGLLDVPWESFDDSYGPAVNAPRMVLAFTTGDAFDHADAGLYFDACLNHQGGSSPATAPVVPFLIDLLEQPSLGLEAVMLGLLSAAAFDTDRPHAGPEARRPVVGDEVDRRAERLHPFLDHPAAEVRRTAAVIVGRLTRGADLALGRLTRRLAVEPDPLTRLTVLVALGWCAHTVGDDATLIRLAAVFEDRDEHPLARSAVAIVLLAGLPPGSDHPALAPALAQAEYRRTRPIVRNPYFGRWYEHHAAVCESVFRHYDVDRLLTEADDPDNAREQRDCARSIALDRLFPEVRPERPWRADELSPQQRRVLELALVATARGFDHPSHLWRGLPHTNETLSAWLGLEAGRVGDQGVTTELGVLPLFQAVRLVLDDVIAEDALVDALETWDAEALVDAAMELPSNRYWLSRPTRDDDAPRAPRYERNHQLVFLLGRLLASRWDRVASAVEATVDAALADPAAALRTEHQRWLVPLLLAWSEVAESGRSPRDGRVAAALGLIETGHSKWQVRACLALVRERLDAA